MPELRDRFESLSRVRVPDLWPEIEGREPGRGVEPSSARRVLVAVVAFVVAIAGIGFAAISFGGSERPSESAGGPVGVANGPIYFRVGGGEGGSRVDSIEPDGSRRRVVFPNEVNVHYDRISFSPDGTRIAFDSYLVDEYGIETANTDGTDVARLTDGVNDSWASWSPDGSRIVFSSTRYDPAIEGCEPGFPHEFRCPTDIYVMDGDGSSVVRLTDDPAGEFMPRWSPDGTRIAFVRQGEASGTYEAVFTMRPDGTDVRQISSGKRGSDFWPSWSPDGTKVVFAAIRNEDWGIWVVDADGSNEHMIFGGTGAGYVDNPVWSPDGTLIAFVGNLTVDDYSPDDALYVMRPDGSNVTAIADAPRVGVAGDIAWQPIPAPAATLVPTPAPSPPTAEVVETFAVGEDVLSVTYGDGSVWVAVSNNNGTFTGRILRIDPVTHELQDEIPVDVIPTWEIGGGAMVVAAGSLWVAGSIEAPGAFDDPGGGADAAVIQIDTSTNEVVEKFELGGTHGADLTFSSGDLWVLLFGDGSVDHVMEVVRVDRVNGHVLARIPLTASWAHTIVAADRRLVVIEGGSQAVNVGAHVTVIDPVTATTLGTETRSGVEGPVVSAGGVWAATDEGFARIDPLTGTLVERSPSLDPSRYAICCGFIEADDRGIWFIGFDGRTGSGEPRLDLFNPESGEVSELVTLGEGTPVAMAVSPDAVWILNYEGTLTHVGLG